MNNNPKHIEPFLPILIGKKISEIRRMTDEEMNCFGWYNNPLVIVLDDKTQIVFMSDNECNEGGSALLYNAYQKIDEVAYTIGRFEANL